MNSISFKSQVVVATLINLLSVLIIVGLLYMTSFTWLTLVLMIYVIGAGILTVLFFIKFNFAFGSLQNIIKLNHALSIGKVVKDKEIHAKDQELKALAEASNTINHTYASLMSLATEIGNKNFDFEFSPKSEEDELSKAMISMKESLREIAEKDAQQNWMAAGLAKFGDLLRTENESLETISFIVISNLCRYLNANQGSLFVYTKDNEDESLDLMAAFAYDKQKFLDKKIFLKREDGHYVYGEGLVGQAFIDKETIFMTQIPEEYIKITSGLGEALPRNILIVPLQYNDMIVGVIELASFATFKEHEIHFVERLCIQIGAIIVAENINKDTRKLLQDASIQSEELLLKENDVKKSYEEIASIQEELSRNENEMKLLKENMESELIRKTEDLNRLKEEVLVGQTNALQKEKQVLAMLNTIASAIFLTSEEGNVIMANQRASIMMGYDMKELIALPVSALFTIENLSLGNAFRHEIKLKNGTLLLCEILVNKISVNGSDATMYYVTDIAKQLKIENEYTHKIELLAAELKALKGN